MTVSKLARGLLLFGFALPLAAGSWTTGVLQAATPAQVRHLLNSRECAGCDLQDALLVNRNLDSARLVGANLQRALLSGATLRGAALKGASFFGADLRGTDLTGATDANLAGAVTNEQTTCPSGQPGPCAG